MKIGDSVYVHGYVDEIRKGTVIIRNEGGYFGTVPSEIVDVVDEQPKVEAIPVEWLHKHSCSNVVDLWRKERLLQDAKDVVCSILEEHNFNSYDEFIRYAWKMKAAAKLLPQEKLNEIYNIEEENESNI